MNTSALITSHPKAVPADGPLGVEMKNVRLSEGVGDEDFALIHRQLAERGVLLIRDQTLTPKQLCDFAARFGELDPAIPNEHGELSSYRGTVFDDTLPIHVISNVVENGKEIGTLGSGEALWHTDMSSYELPSSYTLLYAVEIPPEGGDTYFADMRAAYSALPENLRTHLAGRQLNHPGAYLSGGQLRAGYAPVTDVREAAGARHPLIRTHPITSQKALYLGRRMLSWIVGLPVPESEALLDQLWAHATQPQFVWRQQWRVGDLLIWDNRSVVHRREAFDNSQRRVMLRLTMRREKPV